MFLFKPPDGLWRPATSSAELRHEIVGSLGILIAIVLGVEAVPMAAFFLAQTVTQWLEMTFLVHLSLFIWLAFGVISLARQYRGGWVTL